MHVLPSKRHPGEDSGAAKPGGRAGGDANSGQQPGGFKAQRDAQRKADAGNRAAWNSLFMRADTVAEAVAAHYGVTKAQLLDREAADLPVRMALGEAQVRRVGCGRLEGRGPGRECTRARVAGQAVPWAAGSSSRCLVPGRGLTRNPAPRHSTPPHPTGHRPDQAGAGGGGRQCGPAGGSGGGGGQGSGEQVRGVGTEGRGLLACFSPAPADAGNPGLLLMSLCTPSLSPTIPLLPRSVARSPTTLLVKNLPFAADEDELVELFGRAGTVRRCLTGA
jgi:hypothetical protein